MERITFLIPVFRNAGSLHPTYDGITALFEDELKGYDFEFVFVNDGSDDESLKELLELRERDKRVRVFSLSRNFGQRYAVLCGFARSKGDAVVKLSADMQEPFDKIPQMVKAYAEGNDVVICYRTGRNDGFFSDLASNFFYRIMKISNPRMPKGGFDFWLLSKRAYGVLNSINARNRMLQGDVLWMGFNTKYIPYKRLERKIGESQQSLSKKFKFFIDGLIYTSYLPIRFMGFTGAIFAVLGILYAIFVALNRIFNPDPNPWGWASIMVMIAVVGGLIMLMLGIIGEYLWRIHDQTRNRPDYIVEHSWDDEQDENE